MPSIEATSEEDAVGKVCLFIGHVGGAHAPFIPSEPLQGYTRHAPLLCPITGKVLAAHGWTDSRGNTGTLYVQPIDPKDPAHALMAWESYAGDGRPTEADRRRFHAWCIDMLGIPATAFSDLWQHIRPQ